MKIFALLLFVALATPLFAQQAPVKFGGKTYGLGFSSGPKPSTNLKSLREYVPPGETVENWTSMVSRYEFAGVSPAELASGMEEQAKADNAEPTLTTGTGRGGAKEFYLDFIMVKPEGDKLTMEWNAWRILPSADGGAVALQFAMRAKAEPDAAEAAIAKLTKAFEKIGAPALLRELDPDKL